MSNPNLPTFRGTITGGIQDISALLPLLGTEQCEKHVGSALDGGYLYSAVTPLSIFGSLGIVRASFNIFLACLSIPRYQFLGAKLLHYSGFSLSGTVAPMITIDPKHPERFLAESKLESMLTEEHIGNVPNLTVSWAKATVRWNCMLFVSTLVISSLGLLPYIAILNSGDTKPKHFFPLGFGFPILRVFGSAICVIITQLLIQLRILIIMKSRLIFINIDRLVNADLVHDLPSRFHDRLKKEKVDDKWNSDVAAEKSLWVLHDLFPVRQNIDEGYQLPEIESLYTSEYSQHFGTMNASTLSWITILFCFGLAIGGISTVIGYVGCFFLVQNSTSAKGPLLWLLLEAVLSVLRIFVWAVNPSWDDSEGVKFELRLFNSPVLLTCDTTVEEMLEHNTTAAVAESGSNLEDLVAFAGPRPTFSVQGVEFCYTVAIHNRDHPVKCLIMVINLAEEKTKRRLLVKSPRSGESLSSPFLIYECSLVNLPQTSLMELRVLRKSQPNSHILTLNSVFMTELEAHYDKLNSRLRNYESTEQQKAVFGRTWAMQQPTTGNTNFYSNQQPESVQITQRPASLSDGEQTYFDHHDIQRQHHWLCTELDGYVRGQIRTYNSLLTQVPANRTAITSDVVALRKQIEDIEKKYLIIECHKYFERFVICVYAKWATHVRSVHAKVLENNMKSFQKQLPPFLSVFSSARTAYEDSILKNKLENKLLTDRDCHLQLHLDMKRSAADNRLKLLRERLGLGSSLLQEKDWKPIRDRADTLHDEIKRYSDFHVGLADLLPHNLATTFKNSMSASEQYGILLQFQKDDFFKEMELRFRARPLDSSNPVHATNEQVRVRSRMRAHQLFDMLASKSTLNDLNRIIDSPGLPSISQLRPILRKIDREWDRKVEASEKKLTSLGVAASPQRKQATQTRITQYFVKRGPALRRERGEAGAGPSS